MPTDVSVSKIKENGMLHSAIQKSVSILAEQFNANPINAIAHIKDICKQEKILDTSEQIAEFLHQELDNLNVESVGEYIGSDNTEQSNVLDAFAQKMDFSDVSFVTGMRKYLASFAFPREAQKIDRITAAFVRSYIKQNGTTFVHNNDSGLVLALQIIALNTNLHNPLAQKSVTFDNLRQSLRDGNGGHDFDESFLGQIYNDIIHNPFILNFAQEAPGMTIDSDSLRDNATMEKITAALSESSIISEDIAAIFPTVSDVTCVSTKLKPLFARLMGHKYTIKFAQKNAEVMVHIYEPCVLLKFLFGENAKVVIQPSGPSSTSSLRLASQIATSFLKPIKTFKSTYSYGRDTMIDAILQEKAMQKVSLAKDFLLENDNISARTTPVHTKSTSLRSINYE
jgi:Sec7-like guanine-nucleotide exchange factor